LAAFPAPLKKTRWFVYSKQPLVDPSMLGFIRPAFNVTLPSSESSLAAGYGNADHHRKSQPGKSLAEMVVIRHRCDTFFDRFQLLP
jgi:hypothetical protein